jgi:hypothetical protein
MNQTPMSLSLLTSILDEDASDISAMAWEEMHLMMVAVAPRGDGD